MRADFKNRENKENFFKQALYLFKDTHQQIGNSSMILALITFASCTYWYLFKLLTLTGYHGHF